MAMGGLAVVCFVLSMGLVESRNLSFTPHVVYTMTANGSDSWPYMHLIDQYLYLGQMSFSSEGNTIDTYNASAVWKGVAPARLARIPAPYPFFPTRTTRLGSMLHSVDSSSVSFDVSDLAAAKPVNLSSPTSNLVPGGGYEALCFWQGGDGKTYGVRMVSTPTYTAVVFDTDRPAEGVGNVTLGTGFSYAGSAYCVRGYIFYAIYTIDVRTPSSPAVVHTLPDTPALSDIAVDADRGLLYTPGYSYPNTYLTLFNITAPASPVFVSRYDLPRRTRLVEDVQYGTSFFRLEVDGTMLYLADPLGGVYVIDVATAAKPSTIGHLDIGTYGPGFILHREGDVMYGMVQGGPSISFCALHQY